MATDHLQHTGESIRCTNCAHEFEVSRHDLRDPERLTAKKERIAGFHVCKRRRPEIFPLPDTRPRAIDAYYSREIRKRVAV